MFMERALHFRVISSQFHFLGHFFKNVVVDTGGKLQACSVLPRGHEPAPAGARAVDVGSSVSMTSLRGGRPLPSSPSPSGVTGCFGPRPGHPADHALSLADLTRLIHILDTEHPWDVHSIDSEHSEAITCLEWDQSGDRGSGVLLGRGRPRRWP